MQQEDPFLPEYYYHVYNRGNNKENIFREPANYNYFLRLYLKYIHPIADLFAYCLMPNHFHFALRLKDVQDSIIQTTNTQTSNTQTSEVWETSEVFKAEVSKSSNLSGDHEPPDLSKFYSQQFSNYFNAYAKAFNKRYNRTGSLFQTRCKRKIVTSDEYFLNLIHYIHLNPQKHKFVRNYRDYINSSYHAILSQKETRVARDLVLEMFGDAQEFIEFHNRENDFANIQSLIEDDVF